jgi:hypothetical protein
MTWLGLILVEGLPRTVVKFGNVGGIAFVVPNNAEIGATALHFAGWLAVGAALRLRHSHALGATAAAILYVASGFIWVEVANQRTGQSLLATLYPAILFHPYALMMVATWPVWLVESVVRPLGVV